MIQISNYQKFQNTLEDNYGELFKTEHFAYVSKKFTPKQLAEKITKSCSDGNCILKAKGVKETCRQMKIKLNVQVLADFLNNSENSA